MCLRDLALPQSFLVAGCSSCSRLPCYVFFLWMFTNKIQMQLSWVGWPTTQAANALSCSFFHGTHDWTGVKFFIARHLKLQLSSGPAVVYGSGWQSAPQADQAADRSCPHLCFAGTFIQADSLLCPHISKVFLSHQKMTPRVRVRECSSSWASKR